MSTVLPITNEDLDPLGRLLDDIFRRRHGVTDQHILTDFPVVFAPENRRNSRIIVEDGKVVSHAALLPCELVVGDQRLRAGGIAVVATHPDYRLRGFAASLMRDLQRTIHEEGFDLGFLWTSVPDFYRSLGWEIVNQKRQNGPFRLRFLIFGLRSHGLRAVARNPSPLKHTGVLLTIS